MKIIKTMLALLFGLSRCVGQQAQAAPPGGYIGFSLGSADVKEIDETDTAYKLVAGWTVNQNLGMDITFVTSADTDKEAKSLLTELGLPFQKN